MVEEDDGLSFVSEKIINTRYNFSFSTHMSEFILYSLFEPPSP